MDFDQIDSYEPAIQTIAKRLSPADHCLDYVSQLRMESWDAQMEFRNRYGFCLPAERRYVHKTLWNSARTKIRGRKFRGAVCLETMAVDTPPESKLSDVTGKYEAREALEMLESRLGLDFQLLLRIGYAGELIEAHEVEDGSMPIFRRRVRNLRARARRVLSE